MAKEYIEREAFLDILEAKAEMAVGTPKQVFNSAYKMLELLPAADVVEVVHGEWIESFNFGYWHYDCPFCDDGYAVKERDETKPNYCQNCGAKMDGGRKDEDS